MLRAHSIRRLKLGTFNRFDGTLAQVERSQDDLGDADQRAAMTRRPQGRHTSG